MKAWKSVATRKKKTTSCFLFSHLSSAITRFTSSLESIIHDRYKIE